MKTHKNWQKPLKVENERKMFKRFKFPASAWANEAHKDQNKVQAIFVTKID